MMSKRKAPKTTSPAPKANGMKLARELMGLILLFFGLYLLLCLITFDSRDPGFNHAISTAKEVHNSAGVIGSYLAGMLTDIFGVASYIWPAFFLLLALRQLFYQFSVQWWRVLGFVCLLLCLMIAGTAWQFSLGDIVGGGFIGNTIYGVMWKFLSGVGSLLVGICFFLISLQLMFNISWLAALRALWLWIVARARDLHPDNQPDGNAPTHSPDKKRREAVKNEVTATSAGASKENTQKKRAPIKDIAPDAQAGFVVLGSGQESEKKDFLANIKSLFAFKNQAQAIKEDTQALQESNVLSEDDVYAMQESQIAKKNPNQSQAQSTHQEVAREHGIEEHFFQDTHSAGLNPFAVPWARASDIQAEWASSQEVTCAQAIENTHVHLQAQTSDSGFATGAMLANKPEIVIPETVATVATTPQTHIQESYNTEDFTLETLPQTHQNDVHDFTIAQQYFDDTNNGQTKHPDYEIDLDATMAVTSRQLHDSIPDDNFTFDQGQIDSEGVHEDLALAQNLSQLPDAPIYNDSIANETSHNENAAFNESNTSDDANFAFDGLDSEIDASTTLAESNTEQSYAGADLDADASIDADTSPSFEVLMDADKDGITDLTEEEVGVGGAAKAAPVKIKTRLPHLDLLQDITEDGHAKPQIDILTEKGERLTRCLADFGIQGELTRITPGPVVTMFEFRPAPGIKVSRIANLSDDLSLALKAIAVRIQAPIPGTDTVGIEIPNEIRETVYFKELLASQTFGEASSLLTIAVGKDSAGRPSVADLAKMPHLLVAGATGAGKSVCLNSILLSFLYKARPEDVQLLLIDPKRIELAVYADLPHLVHPVVTDMSHAKNALDWAVHEMDKRYEGMARLGVRNIAGYNQKLEAYGNEKPTELLDLEFMPYLVIIIDELADLMMTAAKEVEMSIVRLAQLARAAGIHMVLATQRPSVDVVTGIIKANFPCRISFQVTSKHDSRTILDTVGAEHLLGRGDMLFKPSGGRLQRLHGAFVSDDEVCNVVEFWKRQQAPMYRVDFAEWGTEGTQDSLTGGAGALADDPIYNDAVEFVMTQGRASISLVQRRFRIGFNKAARYVEQMEQDGVIGPADGSKPRLVIKGREG